MYSSSSSAAGEKVTRLPWCSRRNPFSAGFLVVFGGVSYGFLEILSFSDGFPVVFFSKIF